jgi:hypothetical protein
MILLQARLEFFSSPLRTVSIYNFCVYEKSVVFLVQRLYLQLLSWCMETVLQWPMSPFKKGISLEGAVGDKKWIVLSKPGRAQEPVAIKTLRLDMRSSYLILTHEQ